MLFAHVRSRRVPGIKIIPTRVYSVISLHIFHRAEKDHWNGVNHGSVESSWLNEFYYKVAPRLDKNQQLPIIVSLWHSFTHMGDAYTFWLFIVMVQACFESKETLIFRNYYTNPYDMLVELVARSVRKIKPIMFSSMAIILVATKLSIYSF